MKLRWWEWGCLVAALLIYAAQVLNASPQKSAAFDEQYHLTAGYSYLRTGDPRLATTHPPLMGLLAALALLPRDDIQLPLDHPAWEAGDRFLYSDIFLWEANQDPRGMLETARRPIMVVGGLLLVALYFWARRLLGSAAGCGVLLLACFDPNLLSNSRVVTTDLGLTAFLFIALWQYWRWLERPTWPALLLAGLAAGLAITAKYTGLFIAPTLVLVALLYPRRGEHEHYGRRLLGLLGIGLLALLVVWALFRFTLGPLSAPFPAVPVPAPFYWQQFINTFRRIVDLQGARYDFFWGEAGNQGWWAYFPVALAIKTPLPVLILAGAGIIRGLRVHGWRQLSSLGVVPVLFLALGLSGVLTIGYRHMLPLLPFLILLAGYAIAGVHWRWVAPTKQRLATLAVVLLLAWQVGGSLRMFPHQEAFFNELAGDWYNWSNLLVDSNLDWGQDLPALRQVMDELGIAEVNLAYFGKAVPEVYGVRYRPLYGYLRFVEGNELSAYNPYTPEPGWYAISATSLRLGLMQPDTLDLYRYFQSLRPVARAGYSIYLYHVTDPPSTPVERRVVIGEPLYRLPPEQLGIPAQGRVQVKWSADPTVAIYPLGEGFAPPDSPSYRAVEGNFGDVLHLQGYEMSTPIPGQPLTLSFYWQVGNTPMPLPAPTRGNWLSAFVHLTLPDDPAAKVAQFDGWPTALRGLEAGDVLVHTLQLELPGELAAGTYDLLVGLYSPQSGQRVAVLEENNPGDFLRLDPVVIP